MNQVQHRVFNNLSSPQGGEFEDWDDESTFFLPLIPNFTSSQAFIWGEVTLLPEWLNQWWFPNWTPNYPVVSGNSWLVNLYAKNTSINCDQCLFNGNTGCCKLQGSACFISERLDCESVGGTWTNESCPDSCDESCNTINTDSVTLNFSKNAGSQSVSLSGAPNVCNWTGDASSWITVTPANGTANSVAIGVLANDTGSERSGTVTIQETQPPNTTKIITVIQSNQDDGTGGGGGGVNVECCNYFTGPCCKNDNCTEDQTPQQCYNAKGIFLGFNRTCDDCPS